MKKIKKIATITFATLAGLMAIIVIAAAIAGPPEDDGASQDKTAKSETKASETATSTTEAAQATNKSRDMYQDATSQLYVAQTTLQADFQLIGDYSQNGTDTDALQTYKDDIDLVMTNMMQLQQDIKDGVAESDLKNPDDKLMIDTQLSETVKDFVDITTTASLSIQSMIDGTTTQEDVDTINEMATKFQNTQYTLKTLEGIGTNGENWK